MLNGISHPWLSILALPTGGLQAWSWTAEPHTPQQFQCMTATSCNKVTSYHKSFIISWQSTWSTYKPGRGPKSAIIASAYPPMISGAICWLKLTSQPCQSSQLFLFKCSVITSSYYCSCIINTIEIYCVHSSHSLSIPSDRNRQIASGRRLHEHAVSGAFSRTELWNNPPIHDCIKGKSK